MIVTGLKTAGGLAMVMLLNLAGCAGGQRLPRQEPDYDVIVIGAGMGGLSAATHLAAGGMKVLVLEQHFKVGGCTSSFTKGDFAFDTALHEMSVGGGDGYIFSLMDKAGVLDKVEMIKVPALGRSIFPGLDFVHPDGLVPFRNALVDRWPGEEKNIDAFMALMEDLATEAGELRGLYLDDRASAFFTRLMVPFRQRTLTRYRNWTVKEIVDDHFEDEQLKSVISQFWNYYGPPPSSQWGLIFMVAQQGYLKNGGWQIRGSSSSLAVAYSDRIKELGGTVKTSTRVDRILVEDNEVRGVIVADGTAYTSRYVVSSADPYQTFFRLVGEDKSPDRIIRKLKKWEPNNSLAGVFLGLNVETSFWGVDDYEIFVNRSYDEDAMYKAMMEGRFEEGAVAITIYSNLGDDFYAPEGKASLVLNTYSDYDYWSDDPAVYERQKKNMIDNLINVANKVMPGIRDHIEVQEGMTPRTIHHYTRQYKGTPYGMNFTVAQQDRMEFETGIDGLYLAGSWTFPAHGVGTAQASGYLAANLILRADNK